MGPPMAMATTERGLLMLNLRPRLTRTTSMATDIQPMAMATTERGLLMLSLSPRLTLTTSMATDTPPIAMATTERGLLMLRPSPRPTHTTCPMATQLTDMSTESNQQELKFAMST